MEKVTDDIECRRRCLLKVRIFPILPTHQPNGNTLTLKSVS